MAAEVAVQDALYGALAELGITVYTVRPQAADGGDASVYPHIQIIDPVLAPNDTFSTLGHDFVVRIHTRDVGGSNLAVKGIQGAIYDRLHRTSDLDIAGFQLIQIDRELSFVDQFEGTFDGVCEYHALITEN